MILVSLSLYIYIYIYRPESQWTLYIYIYIYIYIYLCVCVCVCVSVCVCECVCVKSYRRLRKSYILSPCLPLSIIRYGSRVKWSNHGKGVAPSPIPRWSSNWKGSLRIPLDNGPQFCFDTYVAHSISFHSICFCAGTYNWCRLLKIQYVIAIHRMWWLTNFYDFRSKWTAMAAIGTHPTKTWLSQLVNFKNAIRTLEERYAIKFSFKLGKKCHAMKARSTAMIQRLQRRYHS